MPHGSSPPSSPSRSLSLSCAPGVRERQPVSHIVTIAQRTRVGTSPSLTPMQPTPPISLGTFPGPRPLRSAPASWGSACSRLSRRETTCVAPVLHAMPHASRRRNPVPTLGGLAASNIPSSSHSRPRAHALFDCPCIQTTPPTHPPAGRVHLQHQIGDGTRRGRPAANDSRAQGLRAYQRPRAPPPDRAAGRARPTCAQGPPLVAAPGVTLLRGARWDASHDQSVGAAERRV